MFAGAYYQYRTVCVPYDSVADATEKHIGSTGLTVTANDNKVREPLFCTGQNQSLWRSVIDDEFELPVLSAGDFSNTSGCRFGNTSSFKWKLQCGNPADVRKK